MCRVTIFVLVGTNEFITVEVFLRLFTISTRFQNLTFLSHPNGRHFLDWFFNLFVNVSNGLGTFDNLSRIHLVLFHEAVIVILKVDSHWVFQFDGFINRFNTCICGSFDCVTRFVNEFLNDVSFHNRFFYFLVNVGDGLGPFDNLSRIHLVLFDKGVIVILKVDGHWVFQFDSFINRFHSSICRSFDFFTGFIHKFLNDVSFHYRFFNRFLNWFFYFFVDVGVGLGTLDNLSRIHLVLFDKGVIVILKVDGHWVFQFDSFINRFHSSICRSFDFFTGFIHKFLNDVSFHYRFFNRFLNWFFYFFVDVGVGLGTLDNLSRIHLVLFDKGVIVILKVDSGRMFQFDSFINRFHSRVSRSFDFFTGLVDKSLNDVSFHYWFFNRFFNRFFNLFVNVSNDLGTFNNFSRIHLVLSHEGVIVVFKVNGRWMFQFDGFINRFATSIC